MPRLGIALGSVFRRKSQQAKEQRPHYDGGGGVGHRDRPRSPLAPLSPPFSHITVSPSPLAEGRPSAEVPARIFGRKRLSTSLGTPGQVAVDDVHSIETPSLPGAGDGEREAPPPPPPASRRNTLSTARSFVRAGGRRLSRNGGRARRDSRGSLARSDVVRSGERLSHSRSSSSGQSAEPDYGAVARDMAALKRELRRLKTAQSNELFDQAHRRQSTRRAVPEEEAAQVKATTTPVEPKRVEDSEKIVASLRRELEEAMAFAQQWAQAAAKAEAELDRRRSLNEADVVTQRDFEAMGKALAEQQSELATAKAQLEAWRRKEAAAPAPAAADPAGHHDEEQDYAAAPGTLAAAVGGDAVKVTTEKIDDKQAAMMMDRWQIADASSVQLEVLAALLTTEDALREVKAKLAHAEAECASWEERFAGMETSRQAEILRYKAIAETSEAQVEELRSRAEEPRSPSREAQEESASSRLRRAEEEVRRAEEAQAAMSQALDESEARRTDAVDQTRVLEMRLADLSSRCQGHEGDASRKDIDIAALSADMGESLASAEESLRVMEVAAVDGERELSALRSQLETAEKRAKEADEEIARLRSAAEELILHKQDGEIMPLRFTLQELELRQKATRLDAAALDWETETSDLLAKVVGESGERSPSP